jgi:Zn-dependent protease
MNTSASWRFQLLSFPVRVHISFFFVAVLLGLGSGNIFSLLIWVAVVFFSVLVHELGHAITSNYYGRNPYIELYSMGGLTVSTRHTTLTYPREILISASGPLAGFLVGALVFAATYLLGPFPNALLRYAISSLLWVNIGWGLVNLIPILPLDGGQIMRNLYHWLGRSYDERTPLKISMGFGILAVLGTLYLAVFRGGGLYVVLLAAWLTYNNYNALRQGYWTDSIV